MAVVAFLALATTSALISPARVFATTQPDIIVVMVDDLGAIDDRILERLPNIRDLWLGALRFDNYYNETPLCCPGRASFLTGQHTRNHGVNRNVATLLDPSRTLATALHDVGYHTLLVGKYLNKAGRLNTKLPAGWDHASMLVSGVNPSKWYIDNTLAYKGYHDRFTASESVRLLGEAPDKPVFLWANPKAPHYASQSTPWMPSVESKYVGDDRCSNIAPWKPPAYSYSPKPDGWPLGATCRSLLTVDDMVGNLIEVQRERNRDAVWVFTSDNGMAWGWHGFPLKNVPEAGNTVLYFAGAGIRSGSEDALTSNIDLGPTIAALGGATMPWADGRSFASLLGAGGSGREWMLEDHPVGGNTDGPWSGPWKAIRTPKWYLLYRNNTGLYYLYNLENDPWMNTNARANNLAKFEELRDLFPW